jgi:hypothetical protein
MLKNPLHPYGEGEARDGGTIKLYFRDDRKLWSAVEPGGADKEFIERHGFVFDEASNGYVLNGASAEVAEEVRKKFKLEIILM